MWSFAVIAKSTARRCSSTSIIGKFAMKNGMAVPEAELSLSSSSAIGLPSEESSEECCSLAAWRRSCPAFPLACKLCLLTLQGMLGMPHHAQCGGRIAQEFLVGGKRVLVRYCQSDSIGLVCNLLGIRRTLFWWTEQRLRSAGKDSSDNSGSANSVFQAVCPCTFAWPHPCGIYRCDKYSASGHAGTLTRGLYR